MRRGRDSKDSDMGRDGRDDRNAGDGRTDAEQQRPAGPENAPTAYGQPAYGQSPYGRNEQGPYGRTQQEQGSWSPPYGAPAGTHEPYAAPAPTGRGNGRPGLIVLFAFLTQLVVVAAAGNTWVVRHGLQYRTEHNDTLGAFGYLPAVVSWRFTPQDSDIGHVYAATLFGLLALFVVAAVLTLALVRGPITFWRAFVGVWLAVIVATLVNGMVRRAVFSDYGRYDSTGGRVVGIVFQGGGTEVVAGALIGLVAALVAAIVAVATRRRVMAPTPVPVAAHEPGREPDAPPPWYGNESRDEASGGTSPSMRKVQGSVAGGTGGAVPGPTTRLPDVAPPRSDPAPSPTPDADAQATTQFRAVPPPRVDQPTQASPAATPATDEGRPAVDPSNETTRFRRPEAATRPDEPVERPDGQATQAFPRPPDDEDEGHHPDH